MYTEEDIKRFLELIEFYQLEYPVEMNQMSIFELTKICNGIGPDSWPNALRKLATQLFGPYAVIHVPHDVRYDRRIGTRAEADQEFYVNAIKIWIQRWGVLRWVTIAAMRERVKLYVAYRLLVRFAKKAWED